MCLTLHKQASFLLGYDMYLLYLLTMSAKLSMNTFFDTKVVYL